MTEVIAGILDALIESGAHLLDPEARRARVREAVAAERAKWAAMDPRTASQLADEVAHRHHVEDDGS